MTDTVTLKLGRRGVMTLPKQLRETYGLDTGDEFTLLDIGGVFVISPRRSEIDKLADQVSDTLSNQGETLESMLTALREERESYDV